MAKLIKIEARFLEEVLGTANANKEIHTTYIASKAPDALSTAEEVAAIGVDEVVKNGKTVFPRDENGRPFIWNYQIKGFFKEACSQLQRCGKNQKYAKHSVGIRAFKKEIDGLIFPQPRKIFFELAGKMGDCQRPLRASGPQGERVALADSETIPAGSTFNFEVEVLKDELVPAVLEWLAYGRYKALGQWRNSGKGRIEIISAKVYDADVDPIPVEDFSTHKKVEEEDDTSTKKTKKNKKSE